MNRCESCPHAYQARGTKTYGDNIPAFAQGCYFPGDEPGLRCGLNDDLCEDIESCPEAEEDEEDRTGGQEAPFSGLHGIELFKAIALGV